MYKIENKLFARNGYTGESVKVKKLHGVGLTGQNQRFFKKISKTLLSVLIFRQSYAKIFVNSF